MKKKNTVSGKLFIYITLFLVIVIVTFFSMNYHSEIAATVTMTEAKLPVAKIKMESGQFINRMHGYTSDIDETLVHTDFTPLPSNKKLTVVLDTYGEKVKNISYKVRDTKDNSLIEDTKLDGFDEDNNTVEAVLNIKNLLTDEEKYLLEIYIETENYSYIGYYTTIESGQNDDLQKRIDYVLDFNAATLDTSKLNSVNQYLESNGSADNTNFGNVNINNSLYNVGWGDLNPFLQSDIVPSIIQVEGEIMIVALDYICGAQNDYDSYDTYSVHDYYRIRQSTDKIYLLGYSRQTNQIFDGRNDLISNGKINLGICSSSEVEFMAAPENKHTYFVNENTLWGYSLDTNTINRVFSFESDDSDNVREHYGNHAIKIVRVDDSGDVKFIVCGYMNRGEHEGQVGVSVYSYSFAGNEVQELCYIPLNVPYQNIIENVADISYINNNNSLYLSIGNTMYSIDLNSMEVMVEIENLINGTYKMSDNGRIIGYSTKGGLYDSEELRIFNIDKGTDCLIKPLEGDYLKALGFIGDDFIYGAAKKDDIYTDEAGFVIFPMYKIYIMNDAYEIIKEYENEGFYISAAEVDDYRINLSRVTKNDDGSYSPTSIDQLINKDENAASKEAYLDHISTNARKSELVLVLPNGVGNVGEASLQEADAAEFNKEKILNLDAKVNTALKYYVYTSGKYCKAYDHISPAINHGIKDYGMIKDNNNIEIWNRNRMSNYSIKGVSAYIATYDNSIKTATEAVKKFLGEDGLTPISMKGVSMESILSFVSDGRPVIAKVNDGYLIITAYDLGNIVYIDVGTGKEEMQNYTNAKKRFTEAGNIFITYYK